MKTVKIIHYPEGGSRTTEIFESEDVLIEEGYIPSMVKNIDDFFDNIDNAHRDIYGAKMNKDRASKYWIIKIYLNSGVKVAGLNSEVYVMIDGKTVSSYKSFEVE